MRAKKIILSVGMFINVRIGAVTDDRCRIIIILNVSDAIFTSDDVTDFFHSVCIRNLYGLRV